MARTGDAGRASEARVAALLGARLTAASGAVDKGDMRLDRNEHKFLIEAKSTQKETLSVDLGWLTKIVTEAMEKANTPAIVLSFTDTTGRGRRNGDWIAFPLWVLEQLLPPE